MTALWRSERRPSRDGTCHWFEWWHRWCRPCCHWPPTWVAQSTWQTL